MEPVKLIAKQKLLPNTQF